MIFLVVIEGYRSVVVVKGLEWRGSFGGWNWKKLDEVNSVQFVLQGERRLQSSWLDGFQKKLVRSCYMMMEGLKG